MTLWTIQPVDVAKQLEETGIYKCNPDKAPNISDGSFVKAYNWLIKQMKEIIGNSPKGVKYPVWAWYVTDNKHQRPDMRKLAFRVYKPSVLMEVEIPDNEVVLTDFNRWHIVLNNCLNYKANYLENISDDEWWSLADKEDKYFFSLNKNKREAYLDESWKKVIYRKGDKYSPPYIQATFWELKKERITKMWYLKGYTNNLIIIRY